MSADKLLAVAKAKYADRPLDAISMLEQGLEQVKARIYGMN